MIRIKGGSFMMGCDPQVDTVCEHSETLHRAEVGDSARAATETTLWQFSVSCVAEGLAVNNYIYASWGVDGSLPAIRVTWFNAVEYGNWLSRQKGGTAMVQEEEGSNTVDVRYSKDGFRLARAIR